MEQEHNNRPIVETQVSKSKDGKYIIHTTKIVDIKPATYYAKVMDNGQSTGE